MSTGTFVCVLPGCVYVTWVCVCYLGVCVLPGRDETLQMCSLLRGDGGVAGDVKEDEVEGYEVCDHPEEHHWVPPITVTLVQHPKHAPSWSHIGTAALQTSNTGCYWWTTIPYLTQYGTD